MRTRGSDTEKQKDKDIDNKVKNRLIQFQKYISDFEKAKAMVELVNSRELLKNLQLENSIKSKNGLKSSFLCTNKFSSRSYDE